MTAGRGRLMLRTPDFAAATGLLRQRGIITGAADGKSITLSEGRTTAEVVKLLADANIPVEGIWQQDQTLEDFYLSLVKAVPPPPNQP